MRRSAFLLALAGIPLAASRPQAFYASNQTTTVASVSSQVETSSITMAPSYVVMYPPLLVPSTSPLANKRSNSVEKRDGTCAPQPLGAGPVAAPDTPESFAMNSVLWVSQPS